MWVFTHLNVTNNLNFVNCFPLPSLVYTSLILALFEEGSMPKDSQQSMTIVYERRQFSLYPWCGNGILLVRYFSPGNEQSISVNPIINSFPPLLLTHEALWMILNEILCRVSDFFTDSFLSNVTFANEFLGEFYSHIQKLFNDFFHRRHSRVFFCVIV